MAINNDDTNIDSATSFRLWNINQVAECLGVSVKFVEKLRASGNFAPAIRIGRCVRWDPTDIRAYALGMKAAA